MNRPLVYPTLLTLFLGLNHVPLAMAARGTHESAKSRVVGDHHRAGAQGDGDHPGRGWHHLYLDQGHYLARG